MTQFEDLTEYGQHETGVAGDLMVVAGYHRDDPASLVFGHGGEVFGSSAPQPLTAA